MSKYVQSKKMWQRFPYLGRKKGLFVIDVNEDVVPGREAHVICNRSKHGHEQDTQLLRTPKPNHLQIKLQEQPRPCPEPSHHPKLTSMGLGHDTTHQQAPEPDFLGTSQAFYSRVELKPTHTTTLSSSWGRVRGAAGGGLGTTGTCVLLGPVGLLVVGVAVEGLQRADGALPHHGPAAEGPVVDDFDDDGGAVQALAGQTLRVEIGGNTSLHTAPTPKLPKGRLGRAGQNQLQPRVVL